VPSGSEPLLSCEGLGHAYLERFPALEDVSFDVRPGERVALLGANGCGKSTLLRILAGLVFPDRGSYRAFGRPVNEEALADARFCADFRSRVGFVFQDSDAQVFCPSVREEVAFGPLQLGLERAEIERRSEDVMEMLGISELAERPPYRLSDGEKKRVAIASVLVMNPELLLLDEPTAGLDPRTKHWLVELIVELGRAGKTIVLATHDLDLLEWVSDRCLLFSEAHRLVADGPTSEILADDEALLGFNLIHEHGHRHGGRVHSHPHGRGHHAELRRRPQAGGPGVASQSG
jgi:cobalt/nickel transport system ATP-binding protein